ncbi:MAG: 50S ribosomal protein L29 [Spirochaetales bacterium]|nr:50S ribosomal protein L29 [Spirochaetales bacterium]
MINKYKDLTLNELKNKLDEQKKEYRGLRFDMVIGHVDNAVKRRVLRRNIARLNTMIHEFDLGIRKA